MAELVWDKVDERTYETGVDHGVLYLRDANGAYSNGYVWNGLVSVSESPTGAEPTAMYADNIKYLNLISAEEFAATVEAFTYPDEFAACEGSIEPEVGVAIGQQNRETFGLSYRTKIGNAITPDLGHKIHLIYGAIAAPTERGYQTVNESPEAITFSWELSTTPVEVPGFKPTATVTIDTTKTDATTLGLLTSILYGTQTNEPRLPLPSEIFELFGSPIGG